MAIEDFIFPAQSIGTKLAGEGGLGVAGMLGGGLDQTSLLLGLLAPQFLGGREQGRSQEEIASLMPEQFLGQGGQQMAQQGSGGQPQGQQMDPMSLLSQNIRKRFGG